MAISAATITADLANGKLSCRECSLAELCLPRGLDIKDMERFESIVGQRPPYKRGENIYRAGDNFHALYAVKSGSLKTVVSPPDGNEQIIGFSMPGELFGFDGIDDGHTCTAVALERTTLCELPLNAVAEVSQAVPGLHRELYRVMAREISVDQSMLLLLARRTAEDRLAAFLLSLSKRFADRGFSQTDFSLSMSRHDIANYLGLAAETVSRLFGRLSEAGLLTVHGRKIHIQNLDGLRGRVDGCNATQVS